MKSQHTVISVFFFRGTGYVNPVQSLWELKKSLLFLCGPLAMRLLPYVGLGCMGCAVSWTVLGCRFNHAHFAWRDWSCHQVIGHATKSTQLRGYEQAHLLAPSRMGSGNMRGWRGAALNGRSGSMGGWRGAALNVLLPAAAGASALDKKQRKLWQAKLLARLGSRPDKLPRTAATMGGWASTCLGGWAGGLGPTG